jgi:UDP:flavonoid glycosyltransferase YjiC (YdhE family)
MVSAYSPAVIPHPSDWPDTVHITSYLFLDAHAGWQPPPALEAFLRAGNPPVYVGFGSMAGQHPEQLAAVVLKALAKSGQRGLLLTGWGGLAAAAVPENVFVLDSAPHSWLFPRMAAVVHHGGAGTTAEGLRAGVPAVILPFAFDQPFWAARLQALGVAPAPLSRKRLTADRLASAITKAVADSGMKQRARAMGAVIRAEDGVSNAVRAIMQHLGAPRVNESDGYL